MGGDLKTGAGKAPTFLVMALKDPKSGNLDRIQIVKGWLDAAGKQHEKIYDVAWSGDRKIGANGKLPAGRQQRRREDRDVHEQHRRPAARHGLDRSRFQARTSAPSTTRASSRSRRRAGTPTTRPARTCRR